MKNVVIALRMAGIAGAEKLAGVYRWLDGRRDWSVRLIRTRSDLTGDTLRAALRDGADGVILSMPGASDAAAALAAADVPAVVMDMDEPALAARRRNIVFLHNDSAAIGRTAATYLLSQGVYRAYAVAHDRQTMPWSRLRADAFRRTLADIGLSADEIPGTATDADLARRLRRLPHPCAVFATHDDRAADILSVCRRAGLRVPARVAVLGVDNDALLCEHADPPLSSVQPDFEEEGFLAARHLDALMSDTAPRDARTALCGVKTVVCRPSTAPVSHTGLLIQKARAYIDRHATRGIGVPDVVRHLRVSRALADRRFRELQHMSINEAIVERQLQAVRERLIATRDPIERITADCGWTSPNYPKRLFKRRYNMTMRDFRRLYAAAP